MQTKLFHHKLCWILAFYLWADQYWMSLRFLRSINVQTCMYLYSTERPWFLAQQLIPFRTFQPSLERKWATASNTYEVIKKLETGAQTHNHHLLFLSLSFHPRPFGQSIPPSAHIFRNVIFWQFLLITYGFIIKLLFRFHIFQKVCHNIFRSKSSAFYYIY